MRQVTIRKMLTAVIEEMMDDGVLGRDNYSEAYEPETFMKYVNLMQEEYERTEGVHVS